jgi:hypothetical protein
MPHWLEPPWSVIVPLGVYIGLPVTIALAIYFVQRRRHRNVPPTHEITMFTLPSGLEIPADLASFIGEHTWGRAERIQYLPEDYVAEISCLACGRSVLPKQWFWNTPLLGSGGKSFQICCSCQPGDLEAIARGQ